MNDIFETVGIEAVITCFDVGLLPKILHGMTEEKIKTLSVNSWAVGKDFKLRPEQEGEPLYYKVNKFFLEGFICLHS